jgi:hypothetical protein
MTPKLNKKNVDGSVSSYYITNDPGQGCYVPFNNRDFIEQIEENILPAVMHLNSNGYKTITSCQGHSLFDYIFKNAIRFNYGPQITIEVDKSQVKKLVSTFSNFLIKVSINKTITINPITDSVYISIKPWFVVSFFFTNKFLCNEIYKVVNNV